MSILLRILASIAAIIVFLFFFWRRLKEDYSSTLIFNAGFLIIAGAFFGASLFLIISRALAATNIFQPNNLWFWGGFLGLLVSTKLAVDKFRLKFIETFEASLIASSFWLLGIYILNEPKMAAIVLLAICIFFFFENKYRRFQWYKSGRVGFSGLATAGLFFSTRVIVSVASPNMFSFIGRVDLILSAVTAFLLFFSLYNLSEA